MPSDRPHDVSSLTSAALERARRAPRKAVGLVIAQVGRGVGDADDQVRAGVGGDRRVPGGGAVSAAGPGDRLVLLASSSGAVPAALPGLTVWDLPPDASTSGT
jgi:hypothetical protein